jgi:hypothetical protein
VILASNASLWYIPEYIKVGENWGYLIQIDHFNSSTSEEKYTRVMKCDQMPKDKQEEDQNCITLVALVKRTNALISLKMKGVNTININLHNICCSDSNCRKKMHLFLDTGQFIINLQNTHFVSEKYKCFYWPGFDQSIY